MRGSCREAYTYGVWRQAFSGGRRTFHCSTGKFPVTWSNERKIKVEQVARKRLHSEQEQKQPHSVSAGTPVSSS